MGLRVSHKKAGRCGWPDRGGGKGRIERGIEARRYRPRERGNSILRVLETSEYFKQDNDII